MMPIGDDNSLRKRAPLMTYFLILLNVFFFFLELSGGEEFIKKWAFIPNRFLSDPTANIPTLFTAMFMHAGIAHLLGNMLYLWIFGDNIEDRLGKISYLFFYLACGITATFTQLFFMPDSKVPNVGASGAIAGVLGAYIYLWPHGKVNVLVGYWMTEMSALVVIGFWFFLQFISGVGSLASTTNEEGGVAYFAHIGGFVAGLVMVTIMNLKQKKP